MFEIFLVLAMLVGLFFVALKFFVKQEDTKTYRYKAKGPILSAPQTAFYNALREAVGEHGLIFTKVNLSNVVTPTQTTNKKQWYIANNVIAKSYFDFVICDPRTLQPRVVIEYDDGQKLHQGKIERQRLIMQVCKSAELPLIGASVKMSYQVSKLRRLIGAHIDLIEPEKEVRFCKRCGSPMNIKTATQGNFKGRRFFTCSRQPLCQYTENYNVVFEDDSERQ
ncbi:DUF2726 domain-containing protein [Vibrio methylphosphonaticus]|uniref:DUF2726 domain-containing protein n=1 Tax=Vibrio methylphosphonaticus TaxID=2946866 RepID=UPI00202ABBFB|nr:DUF2726 domain-containing protein [Vibrio methylphosphonaticus]MCL9774923.1 DUF2726 domain-containing protein [Vibrio methylphosphonaticus]